MSTTDVFWAAFVLGFIAFVIGGFVSMMLLFGEAFIEYRVVNETQQPLLTWWTEDSCPGSYHYRDDVPLGVPLAPGAIETYSTSTESVGGCIVITDENRRIVLTRKYEEGALVTVTEPLSPISGPLPQPGDLPDRPDNLDTAIHNLGWPLFIALVLTAVALSVSVVGLALIFLQQLARVLPRRKHTTPGNGLPS